MGTIKGEKLNEPEYDLSPICNNKEKGLNPARMDLQTSNTEQHCLHPADNLQNGTTLMQRIQFV